MRAALYRTAIAHLASNGRSKNRAAFVSSVFKSLAEKRRKGRYLFGSRRKASGAYATVFRALIHFIHSRPFGNRAGFIGPLLTLASRS